MLKAFSLPVLTQWLQLVHGQQGFKIQPCPKQDGDEFLLTKRILHDCLWSSEVSKFVLPWIVLPFWGDEDLSENKCVVFLGKQNAWPMFS